MDKSTAMCAVALILVPRFAFGPERNGYKIVFKRDDYLVLHRPGSGSASSGSAGPSASSKEAPG